MSEPQRLDTLQEIRELTSLWLDGLYTAEEMMNKIALLLYKDLKDEAETGR